MKTQVMENRHNLANFVPKTCQEVAPTIGKLELVGPEPAPPAPVGSQQNSQNSASAPSTEDWPGKYGFSISFKDKGAQNGKLHSWLWSEELQKLFVEMNKPCPFDVRAQSTCKEQLFVRALPLYTTATNVLRVVKRCPNHASPEDPTNIDVPEALRPHLIRAECGSAVYEEDSESKRLSVRLPLGRPEPGANWTTLLFKFMCLGSCVGGINRRALQVIFTLETASGEVVGRQCIGVRICACPSRDRKVEERKFEMNSNGDILTSMPNNAHLLLPPLSRKRSGSVNSNPSLNANANQNFLCAPKPKAKIENGHALDESVYVIKVHCYANYLLLKEIAYALEVKSHASELYPQLMEDIMPLMGDTASEKVDAEYMSMVDRETTNGVTCKIVPANNISRPNLCMPCPPASTSAPSSNPASGCVSPDSEVPPPFPPPAPHQQALQLSQQQLAALPLAASKLAEQERKQLKRSLSHCTSLPANVRVTTSSAAASGAPPIHVKRLCAVPASLGGDVKPDPGQLVLITTAPSTSTAGPSNASPPPPGMAGVEEAPKQPVTSDGLYMLAEQADRLARDPSVSGGNSRRGSPECEVVRIRAASMSASDFRYRERFSIFSPSIRSCQVQTDPKGSGTDPGCNKATLMCRKPSSPPLIVARYQPVQQGQPPTQSQQQVQSQSQQAQQHQRSQSLCIDSGPSTSAAASPQFSKPAPLSEYFPPENQGFKEFLESLGMSDVWKNWFERQEDYHGASVSQFAWWTEEDFECLGVDKRCSHFLVAKLARYKHALSTDRSHAN